MSFNTKKNGQKMLTALDLTMQPIKDPNTIIG